MLKSVVKVVFAFVLVALVFIGYALWIELPIKNYCDKLSIGETIEKTLSIARENKFVVPSFEQSPKDGTVIINNHMSPFFRVGCFIKISNGKVVGAEVYGTD